MWLNSFDKMIVSLLNVKCICTCTLQYRSTLRLKHFSASLFNPFLMELSMRIILLYDIIDLETPKRKKRVLYVSSCLAFYRYNNL